jgi:hypothetical protein
MQKLSPSYRNDNEDVVLPEDVKKFLDENFLNKLNNLHQPNPKMVVVFSGGNGLGKSTLSERIGDELKALVLENDRIKTCLLEIMPDIERDKLNGLSWKYSVELYSRLDKLTPNGLVVRDGVIDWYYDRVLPIFESRNYSLFVVGYDVSRAKRIELITKRGEKPTTSSERLIQIIDEHAIHTERFRKHYTPDIILSDTNLFDYDPVIAKIKDRLSKSVGF